MVQSKVKDGMKAHFDLKNTVPAQFATSERVSCN